MQATQYFVASKYHLHSLKGDNYIRCNKLHRFYIDTIDSCHSFIQHWELKNQVFENFMIVFSNYIFFFFFPTENDIFFFVLITNKGSGIYASYLKLFWLVGNTQA